MRHSLRFLLLSLLLGGTAFSALAQQNVGIGTTTPNAKAALDISASDKGLLIPRMDSVSRAAIGTPPDGLMVFQTDGRKGFWYAMGGSWLYIPDKTRSGDNLGSHTATQNLNLQANALTGTGNSISGVGVGITSAGGLNIGQHTNQNVAIGYQAGQSLSTGSSNLLEGYGAGANTNTGSNNVFLGYYSGSVNTTGSKNLGIGYQAGPGTNGLSNAAAIGTNAVVMQSNSLVLGGIGADAVRVGIGTPQPAATLHVAGASSTVKVEGLAGTGTRVVTADANGNLATVTTASLADNLGNHTATQNLNLNGKLLVSGGTSGLQITSGGQVGIGVNPANTLDVGGSMRITNTNGVYRTYSFLLDPLVATTLMAEYRATTGYGPLVRYVGAGVGSDYVDIGQNRNGDFAVQNTAGGRLTFTQSGSLGVGTTAPAATLHVSGISSTVRLEGLTGTGTRVVTADANGNLATVTTASLADNLGNHTATQNLNLGANQLVGNGGTSGVTISNSGNVGIGTTAPAAKFDVLGGADSNGASDPFALAFQYRSGGYRHWIRTRHNANLTQPGNAIDFFANNSNTSAGSSAPTTGTLHLLTLDNNNGQARVGVGTTAPTASLHVSGTGSTVRLEGLTGTGTRVVTADANGNLATVTTASLADNLGNHTATTNLNLGTNKLVGAGGSAGLFLTANAHMGLGVSGNIAKVHIVSETGLDASDDYVIEDYRAGNSLTQYMVQRAANGTRATPTSIGDGSVTPIQLGGYMFSPHNGSTFADAGFLTAGMEAYYRGDGTTNATELRFRTSGSPRMVLDPTGQLGVGTTSPSAALDVNGTTRLRGLSGTGTRMVTADASGNLATQALPTDAQTLSLSGSTLSLTNGGSVTLPDASSTNELQTISKTGSTVTLSNGGGSFTDTDTDAQTLSVSGGNLSISGGNSVALTSLDAQQLTKTGSTISLTNGGSVTDADNQNLTLSGAALSISGGTGIALPDADATNELQTISKTGSTITLSNGGGSVTDADGQTLSISGSTISLTNGGSVTVPSSADNLGNHTATQDLDLGANTLIGNGGTTGLQISGNGRLLTTADNLVAGKNAGNSSLSGINNTLLGAQSGFSLAGGSANTLTGVNTGNQLTSGGENTFAGFTAGYNTTTGGTNVAVGYYSGYNNVTGTGNTLLGAGADVASGALTNATAVGNNAQVSQSNSLVLGGTGASAVNVGIGTPAPAATLHVAGITSTVRLEGLTGSGTRMVTTDASGNLSSAGIPVDTDAQQLTKTGNTISLTNGGSVTDADNQNLSLSGAALSISGGTGITLPDADATNELQTISKTGNTVTLSNGGGSFTDTDAQTLSLSGQTLAISGGNSVTVPVVSATNGLTLTAGAVGLGGTLTAATSIATGGNNLNITGTGNVGIGGSAGTARLLVSSTTNDAVTATGTATTGTWLTLTNTSAGGAAWNVISTGSANSEGAGKLLIRDAANGVRATFDGSGNLGVGTTSPATKLDVAGGFKLGSNGTTLAAVIKATVNVNVPNVAAGSTQTVTFTVTNAQTTGTAFISPSTALTDGLVIQYARVSAANTVEVKFHNPTAAAINPAAQDYYLTVIQ